MTDQSYGILPILKTENGFKILILKHLKGHWGLPKGHPEGNETPLETAIREFKEETGLNNLELINGKSFSQIYPIVLNGQKMDKIVTYFPAFVDENEKLNLEKIKLDYMYINSEDIINKLNIPKESWEIIGELNTFIKSLT